MGERGWLQWAPGLGMLAGAAVGLVDVFAFRALGVEYVWDGRSAVGWMVLVFGGTYAWLGWLLGRLLQQRAGLRAQRDVIAAQLAELEAHGRRLAEAERLAAIGSMAAGVAHEVRNPLGVIRSSAMLVAEDLEPAGDGARATTFIVEEVDRLDAFVGQLLDFARPLSPARDALAVDQLAEAARHSTVDALDAAGVELELELPDGAPQVAGDRDLLVTVLVTGLVNAAQALARDDEATGAARRVAIRLADPVGDGRVAVEIADSGPGPDDDIVQRAFEPFATTRARGTGLGLAMARRIVEAHGGHIELIGDAGLGPGGRGACLRLELPRAYRQPAPPQTSSDWRTHRVTA